MGHMTVSHCHRYLVMGALAFKYPAVPKDRLAQVRDPGEDCPSRPEVDQAGCLQIHSSVGGESMSEGIIAMQWLHVVFPLSLHF